MNRETIQLPLGWRWAKLGEVIVDSQPGFACGERDPQGIVQLRMNNVDTRGNLVWDDFIRVPSGVNTLSKYQLIAGDVIFNNTNSTKLVGKSAMFTGYSEPVVYSNHFTRLRVVSDKLTPSYLALWLILQGTLHVFENLCNRWIGQSAVKNDKLLALEIPLPPLPEQRRIAAILNEQMAAVERARKAAEEQLEAAKALIAAYLRELFESEQAKLWPKYPLRTMSEIGSGITLGRRFDNIQTRSVPYLRVANVKDGFLDLKDVYIIQVPESDIQKCKLQFGDILLTEGGDPDKLGRGTYWQDQIAECIHQNHIYRVRFDLNRFDPRFIAAQIGSPYGKAYFLTHAKQTTGIATINQKVLGNFPLMCPSIEEQSMIAAFLKEKQEATTNLVSTIEELLKKTTQLPQALLKQAFSGEI